MILGKWPTCHTNSFLCTYFYFYLSTCFEHIVLIFRRETVSVQPLVTVTLCRWPCHVQVGSELPTCTWHGHQHRVTVTSSCTDTICLSDDEHNVLETCRELKRKINTLKGVCASRWSFTKNETFPIQKVWRGIGLLLFLWFEYAIEKFQVKQKGFKTE